MRATIPSRPPLRRPLPPAKAESASVGPARISYRRALAVGLGVSATLHLGALLLASRTRLGPSTSSEFTAAVTVRGERGIMRVERVVPVPDAASGTEDPVRRERRDESAAERPPDLVVGPPPDVRAGEAVAGATAAERLSPRMGDPRPWARGGASPAARAAARNGIDWTRTGIVQRLEAWNDSLDWTLEGEDGARWGASPGKIHLGGWTTPGRILLGPTPWQRGPGDTYDRARMERELADQIAGARVAESLEERIRAIRERMERERAKKKAGSGSGSR